MTIKFNPARYPYTYAADAVREWVQMDAFESKISRGDASFMLGEISRVIGFAPDTLKRRIADDYITRKGIKRS